MACKRTLRGQRRSEDHERNNADGQVDIKDPAPRPVRGEVTTDEWTSNRSEAESRAENALITSAGTRRHDVSDHGLGRDGESASAEPLNRAKQDQVTH